MNSVSYLVPVYNAEKFIARCIESCLDNMYEQDELILVDDGSADSSGKICDFYADKNHNIKVIHQVNSGESAARNSGLKAVSKEWIVCVDADDFLDKGARKILEKISSGIDIVLYAYQQEDAAEFVKERGSGKIRDYGEAAEDLFITGCFWGKAGFLPFNGFSLRSVWAKAFRAAFIEQNNIRFHEGVFIGEDFEFMLECYSKASGIRCVDEVLYHYFFQNSNSVTNRYKPYLVDNTVKASNAMQKWLQEYPQYRNDYAAYCLNMLILHTRDDFFNPENKMSTEEKYQHIEEVIEKGGYKKYYDTAVRSGKIKMFPLSKRILFFAAVHRKYKLLEYIYKIRYRLMR